MTDTLDKLLADFKEAQMACHRRGLPFSAGTPEQIVSNPGTARIAATPYCFGWEKYTQRMRRTAELYLTARDKGLDAAMLMKLQQGGE